ncbi:response regulator [Seohaeicola saemankumensis]|nr:response regulator [Seohaeicola saemankumensis]MCA0871446.1 response regulator [Seohaeicola saemankumensis]
MTPFPVTILVLDDDSSVRSALARLLKAKGFAQQQLDSIASLRAALPLPADSCLLVDIVLDQESGLDVPGILRDRNELVPVVFMSATDDEEMLAKADTTGATRCLRKPFEADELVAALEAAVTALCHAPVLHLEKE